MECKIISLWQVVLPTTNDTSSESVVTNGQHQQQSPQHVSQELNTPQ